MSLAIPASLVWFLGGLGILGLGASSSSERFGAKSLLGAYSAVGWLGVIGGTSVLQFGDRWNLESMPVPVALGVAAAGALAVAPLFREDRRVAPLAAFASGAVALVAGGGAAWMALTVEATPWGRGAGLLGAHWAVLAAATAAALTGALAAGRAVVADAPPNSKTLRAHARDATLRAVLLLWVGWFAASLVHRRFLGAVGLGSRSEWFAVGTTLLATGILFAGWEVGDDRAARIRSTAAPIAVAVVVVAGLWLSFGFGSPFGLSLPS